MRLMPGSLAVNVTSVLLPSPVLVHFLRCFLSFSLLSPWCGPEDLKKKKQSKSSVFLHQGLLGGFRNDTFGVVEAFFFWWTKPNLEFIRIYSQHDACVHLTTALFPLQRAEQVARGARHLCICYQKGDLNQSFSFWSEWVKPTQLCSGPLVSKSACVLFYQSE